MVQIKLRVEIDRASVQKLISFASRNIHKYLTELYLTEYIFLSIACIADSLTVIF